MRADRVEEKLLVEYLLGNLPEAQQVEVEDRAFADSEYMKELEAVEADLIDAYVRGELPQAQKAAFEQQFLGSPQRRSKVEFARALASVVADAAPQVSVWQTLSDMVHGWSPALRWSVALATLLCVAGVSWMIGQNAMMRSQVAVLESERRDLQGQQERLQAQIREEQTRSASLAAELQKRLPSVAASTPLIASVVLLPGLSRAGARVEQLVLKPSVQLANIEIQLEAADDYPQFRVELRTRSGDEVLARSNLKRRRTGAGFAVSFDVPTSVLTTGEYELALKGSGPDRAPEDIGYYYFSVRK